MALLGESESATQHVWVGLKRQLRLNPALSIMRAIPAAVNGPARSLVNSNGDLGSCSRCNRLKIRNSSPMIG